MTHDDEHLDEGPSEADLDRFSGVTRTCPNCGGEVHDDTELCYHCGHAFMQADKGLPGWVLLLAVVALVGFVVILLT